MIWLAPSVFTICGSGQNTGANPPAHWKVIVTGERFHPAAFGAGDTDGVIRSGCTFWRLNNTLTEAVFPAISTAEPLIVCVPFVLVVTREGQVKTPDKLSEQLKLTVAVAALMIPPGPGAGETVALITGGLRSIFSVVEAVAVCPAASVAIAEIN